MRTEPSSPQAMLTAWREQRQDRHDPLRFAQMEALQRRLMLQHGPARQRLEATLSGWIAAYAESLQQAPAAAPPTLPAQGALGAVLAVLARTPDDTSPARAYPELPALQEFRERWSVLRSQRQLRDTLAQAPSDGGPLNSSVLVHRTLGWIGEVSPGYLQHLLGYVDNLAWLEQLPLPAAPGSKPVARSPRPRRPRVTKAD